MLTPAARLQVAAIVTSGRLTPDDVTRLRAIAEYGTPSPQERSAIDELLARANPAAAMQPPPAPALGQQLAAGQSPAGQGVSATPGLGRRYAQRYGYITD